ncbi:hypothetical protein B6U81_04040 [Thermoplasmatales archaeon ex4484_30]|nr:MAG: helix-hairpin-helix domain-containing protein [Thermoplasmata archaeon]OYT61014.1 MAG: hypothetical protein B6U81_04040 [Thermoplasmatales archaeon ex4484_30]
MELKKIRGIGIVYEKKLFNAGVTTAEELILTDSDEIASKTGIKKERIEKWKNEARNIVEYKKAEIAEDISRISFIEFLDGKAKVRIKGIWHDSIVFSGDFGEAKEKAQAYKIAVYKGKKPKLWFNGKWYENIPYKMKEKGLFEKLKEWWEK